MNKALNAASNLFLMLLFSFSIIYLVIDCFGFFADSALPLYLAVLCLFIWAASNFRHGVLVGLPASCIVLYLAYRQFNTDLVAELRDVIDRITGTYFGHFNAASGTYVFADAVSSHTLVIIFLAYLLISAVGLSLSSERGRITLTLVSSLPVFFGCIAVSGSPGSLHIVGLLLFWALVMIGGSSYNPVSASGRAVFAAIIPLCLALCLPLLIYSPGKYEYDYEDMSTSLRFDRLGNALGRWIEQRGGSFDTLPAAESGAPVAPEARISLWQSAGGGIGLDSAYDYTGAQQLVLRAKADDGGRIYLRGRSYGDYTGTGWLPAEDYPGGSAALGYTAAAISSAQDGDGHSIRISMAVSSDCMYLPYFSENYGESDSSVSVDAGNVYTAEYLTYTGDISALSVPDIFQSEELQYRAYAHEYYTRLPDSTREAMLTLAGENGIYADSPNIISDVAAYIRSAGLYNLDTQPYPASDYALYFLTTAKEGYCIHFASAATAMYRSLGIPARLVEGFVFEAAERRFTDVNFENAHAWVEVYIDALGWLPVEVTGGSATEPAAAAQEPASSAEPDPGSSTEPENTPPVEPAAIPAADTAADFIGVQPLQDAKADPAPMNIWLAVIAVCMVLLALPMRRLALLLISGLKMNSSKPGKAVVEIWRRAEKLRKFGINIPERIQTCAERAVFSRHGVSADEVEQCKEELEKLLAETCSDLTPWRKFVFKYIYCNM